MEYRPSISEIPPNVVPFTFTETPIMDSPCASVITPVTINLLLCCWLFGCSPLW